MYLVKPAALASLPALSAAMDAFLATCPGFQRRTVHQDAKTATRFMDIVEWRSLGEAEAAAQKVEQGAVPDFMEAMEELVSLDHVRVYGA